MRAVLHSYSLRRYSREHVFAVARAGGWDAVELAACHLDLGNVERDLGAAVEQAARAGVAIHCVGYWGMFADRDPRTRQASLDWTHATIDAAATHGIGLVNGSGGWLVHDADRWSRDWRLNGSSVATGADYDLVARAYRELAGHAGRRGVQLNVEIHPNTVHDTAAATARLFAAVGHPGLGVTFDPSNAAPLSLDDREPGVLALLAGRSRYFHLKNCTVAGGVADFTVDAAGGIIDNYRWLAELVAAPDCRAVCVEYCGEGDPHPRLATSHRYLTDTLHLLTTTTPTP